VWQFRVVFLLLFFILLELLFEVFEALLVFEALPAFLEEL
jgi:hypothetical protein